MTTANSISLETFQQQILPLLEKQASDDASLQAQIKQFTQSTDIVDEHGEPIDVQTMSIKSASNEPADNALSQSAIEKMVATALSKTRNENDNSRSKAAAFVARQHDDLTGTKTASGFGSLGDFALAVKKASAQGGNVDQRLITKTPTTFANEASGDSGGYLVPQDWAGEIWNVVLGDESIVSRTNQIPTSRNSLSVPVSESTPWGSSGVQAYWTDEGSQISQSKPRFEYRNLRLNKLAALVPASDELLEDATALTHFIAREAARAIRYKADDAIINGDGVAKPLGILTSDALVTVSKETSQTADTVVEENIAKMYARMPASSINRSIWLMNQDVLPQLLTMTLGNQPVYLPPNGLAGSPYGTLLGRPIVLTQHAKTLGDLGDIVFADMSQYLTLTKAGSLATASSMHLWFDYDLTAFRFTFRIAGQPWMSSAITPDNSAGQLSPFVALEARS